ncbi:unnamed protein product [Cercopithifilaria johnstoni]|uniref:Uncharacterized protein n=1 Tax=Cercopithifilaria johnstoni TaxID=2874296 RepID=A0A8J2M0J5_9BILA|nr:unnamed protein product [Cercopithifilaria johnstoni]
MRLETKVYRARKLPVLFFNIAQSATHNKYEMSGTSHRVRKRMSCRERWIEKYYNLSLSGWLTKPRSPMESGDLDDESSNTSSSPNPLSQNFMTENGLRSIQLIETSNNELVLPNIQLFTETILQQIEPDNSSLILPANESDDQLPSNYLPNIIQRVRQNQLCIDPKDFVIPYTPITVEERLAGTDEVQTTVIDTCGMTSLPYTLHDDDPFDTKYPNFKTKLPPISTFFNCRHKRQS